MEENIFIEYSSGVVYSYFPTPKSKPSFLFFIYFIYLFIYLLFIHLILFYLFIYLFIHLLFIYLFIHFYTLLLLFIIIIIIIIIIISIIIIIIVTNSTFIFVLSLYFFGNIFSITCASNVRAACIIIPYNDGFEEPIQLPGKRRYFLAFATSEMFGLYIVPRGETFVTSSTQFPFRNKTCRWKRGYRRY